MLASAIVVAVPDPKTIKCGRNIAAWIGLVPKQSSSGGKERLGLNSGFSRRVESCSLGRRAQCVALRMCQRQTEAEAGALCLVFKVPDAAAIGFRQGLADHQPEPHAAGFGRIERLEETLRDVGR